MTTAPPCGLPPQNGHLPVVQVILASGREIDTKVVSSFNNKTAAAHARSMANSPKQTYENDSDPPRRKKNNPIIADLIEEYEQDPVGVRTGLGKELGLPGLSLICLSSLVVH